MDTLSKIPKKIFNFFTHQAEELAKTTQFTKRQSKLTPTAFIRALLRNCFSHHFTLELFCSALRDENVSLTKQSLFERFNERTSAFLASLTSVALKQFKTQRLPQLSPLEQFTAVNIIDSSIISLNGALSKLFKGSGGAASPAAIKIQAMYDYLNSPIKDLALTSGCDNDQGFDQFMGKIEKNALYLMDLGYFKLDSFRKMINGGAFFISRLLPGTKLVTREGQRFELIKILQNSPHQLAQELLMGAKAKIPVRLVAQRLPPEMAEQRRRALREGHRRRGLIPSKELLLLQEWSIYITNTTEAQISHQDIHTTYACRWQIELLFKLSKSLMQIDSSNTTKPFRVVIEIYGKFLCMMLLFLLCAPVRYQQRGALLKEISFYKACKLLLEKASDFIHALRSIYHLKRFFTYFWEHLALFAIKEGKNKPPLFHQETNQRGGLESLA